MKEWVPIAAALCLVSLSLFLMITSWPGFDRDAEGGRKTRKKILP